MLELVNEPMGPSLPLSSIHQFYYDGWGNIRTANPSTAVVIHDAFEPLSSWNGFMNTAAGVNNVVLDTHQYQVFSDAQVAMSPAAHVAAACALGPQLAAMDKWTVVGEWTGAQTDCAKWLNGFGVGARYDGTYPGSAHVGDCAGKDVGTVAGLSEADKENLGRMVEAQMDAYEAHTGWIFWAWKTESAPEWHFMNLTSEGIVPQPLTSRKCKFGSCEGVGGRG